VPSRAGPVGDSMASVPVSFQHACIIRTSGMDMNNETAAQCAHTSVPMHSARLVATQMVSKTSIAQLTGVGVWGQSPRKLL
jgi:hypothetical protein